jgi:hypothetical protein
MQPPRIVAALAAASLLLAGAGTAGASAPAYVAGPLHSPGEAAVAAVVPSLQADIVVLDGGLEAGLRKGMVCRVVRGAREIGEVVVVASRPQRSAALILALPAGETLQAGDRARLKPVRNRN